EGLALEDQFVALALDAADFDQGTVVRCIQLHGDWHSRSSESVQVIDAQPQILEGLHGRSAARAEYATTRMLEGPDQVQAFYARHRVLSQLRRRPVGAVLDQVEGNAVDVALAEARRMALHVQWAVAVVLDD